MNIERFVQARKAMRLSQSDVAEGICTQTTVSRFEKNGQVPNVKTLQQLCERVNLTLGDIFPKVEPEDTTMHRRMHQVEFYLITSEYDKAHEMLADIVVKDIQETALQLRYYYLKGFIMIYQEAPIMELRYVFDQILLDHTEPGALIFQLLAYTGTGLIYMLEGESDKAAFYFDKVLNRIYHYPIKTMEDTWRVLHIVFQCGVYYASIHEWGISHALLTYVVAICSDNHVTYYLARAAVQLAKNAIAQGVNQPEILALIYDARAYAKINRNTIALDELAQMEAKLKPNGGNEATLT